MLEIKIELDIEKWINYERCIFEPYCKELIKSKLKKNKIDPEKIIFRGGFSEKEDLIRLIKTGSDYESISEIFAVPFERLGTNSRVRGLDPIYWAVRGHAKENDYYNSINVIVAYWIRKMVHLGADFYAFKNGISANSAAALIYLEFDKTKMPKPFRFNNNPLKTLRKLAQRIK